ncbi:gamma subclass chorismate mutase AroQ [Streptomyces sp. NPDC050610]|uniref:gamma subclass chorismate mutase AroQ n=1 Tax=Streptomyces sp. NPDC050610 TaxID=3157097 RepID=UPI00343DD6EE
MSPCSFLRRSLLSASAAVLVAAGFGAGAGAGTAAAEPRPAAASSTGAYARLLALADLSARRLATGDLVAAAKWGTGGPIDDPARERQVLDAVARQAAETGVDPAATVRIFRDQIEASKVVQRALHRQWEADPSTAPDPSERPDLAEVRLKINRLNGELVRAIAGSGAARTARSCDGLLAVGAVRTRMARHLDAPHTVALARALPSVCEHGSRHEHRV